MSHICVIFTTNQSSLFIILRHCVCIQDGGSPRLSTTIDFNVIIRNELELPPVFTQPRYTADLTENTAGVVYTNVSW